MPINVGICGGGRIGRMFIRATLSQENVRVVAVNDPFLSPEYFAYQLKYDTVHGRFPGEISHDDKNVYVNGQAIRFFQVRDAAGIPWQEANVHTVLEATGIRRDTKTCLEHITATSGVKRVVISAPAKDATPMFVVGVNEDEFKSDMKVISNASCTTNCLAPMAKILDETFGIEEGLMTTVHATTATQLTVDGPSKGGKDWRGGRAASGSIIPSSTGAAAAVGVVLPSLNGKLTGMAFRVPTLDVSVVDLTVRLKTDATYKQICDAFKAASEGAYKGIVGYTDEQVVSADFITDARSCIFDAEAGIELGKGSRMFKVIGFYDNEFGYSSRLVDLINHAAKVDGSA